MTNEERHGLIPPDIQWQAAKLENAHIAELLKDSSTSSVLQKRKDAEAATQAHIQSLLKQRDDLEARTIVRLGQIKGDLAELGYKTPRAARKKKGEA